MVRLKTARLYRLEMLPALAFNASKAKILTFLSERSISEILSSLVELLTSLCLRTFEYSKQVIK
jgi:hypothetical protein